MERFRPLLAAHNMTEQQWRVIRILVEKGMLDASELSEKAFILAPSLTRILRTLEERGYITKSKDPKDARRVLLHATPVSLKLIEDTTPESSAINAAIEATYGAEKAELLLDLLEELARIKR